MNAKKSRASDKRRYARFPVMSGFIEPITLRMSPEKTSEKTQKKPRAQPAILTDLSAGGLSILTFMEPPHSKKIEMTLSIPGLKSIPVEGIVARILEKGETYKVGIAFTKIDRKYKNLIDSMAQDNQDCDIRTALRLPEICVRTCRFHNLCAKAQKGPYWKK
ncbi:MAG: PilZ domain-containing protein [Elusimicrobiota bacterium]